MPRPGENGAGAVKRTGGNPISNWWKNRKAREAAEKENEAQKIINDAAANEGTFITELDAIRFEKSKLPMEYLEYKSNPEQRYGDLENTALWLKQEIARNTKPVSMDTRELDQLLLQLIARFREAVALGDKHEAFAANGALTKCFKEIRFRLPEVLPLGTEEEFASNYIRQCASYVNSWINLLDQAQYADRVEANLNTQKKSAQAKREAHDNELNAFRDEINSNPQKRHTYETLMEADPNAKLTPEQKELRTQAIELGVKDTVWQVAEAFVEQEQNQLTFAEGRVEMLQTYVNNVPIPLDPNMMNKFNEDIEKMNQVLAAADQEIEENLEKFAEINGIVESVENLPGSVLLRQAAAEQVMKMTQEAIERQEAAENNREPGILDMIQSSQQVKQRELEIQQEMQQQAQNYENEQGEQLYN